MLLEAIRLTVPRFDLGKIASFSYTVEEIMLVNQIARVYANSGNRRKAIGISSQLLKHIEKNNASLNHYPRQFCLVASNCALDLAYEKLYKKAVKLAEKGQKVCIERGEYQFLPTFTAVLAECWYFLGDPEKSTALYHQSTFNDLFVKGLSVTAGLRLEYEKMSMNYFSDSNIDFDFFLKMAMPPLNIPFRNLNAAPLLEGKEKNDYVQLLPKLAFKYDFSPANNMYVSITRGYRSGGYNVQMFSELIQSDMQQKMIEAILDKAPESMAGMIEGMIKQHMPNYGKELNVQETTVYKPEYSWNYEVGSHLSLFNGKLKTDLAAFYMDTHDQQIAKFVNSGLGRMMVNAGSSESYGVEASFLASINKNLNMNVSYGYTHSTFKKYDGGTTSSEEQIDYSGNYVPFVPRHTMNAGANYSFFFDKSNWMQSLTLGMSYTGAGKIYWTEKNNVSQSFYGTLNGRISLQTKALQIDVWGRNLTNKDYTTFYFETMHRGFEQKSRPLQLGVDIRYHF